MADLSSLWGKEAFPEPLRVSKLGASMPRFSLPAHLANELLQLQLLIGDVPLLQVHAGLAGFATDGAPPAVDAAVDGGGQLLQAVLVVAPFAALRLGCVLVLSGVFALGLLLAGRQHRETDISLHTEVQGTKH